MGRIAAIGGGDLMTTRRINQYIVEMSGKEKPAFLFIGTASRDDLDYTSRVCAAFEELGCAARELALTKRTCRDEEIDEELSRADTIYVGGGDTAFVENGGRVAFVTSDENAHAYVFELKDGRHEKREQRMQVL